MMVKVDKHVEQAVVDELLTFDEIALANVIDL